MSTFSEETQLDIERSLARLADQKEDLVQRMNEINARLSQLNVRVRGNILPKHQYQAICDEQNKLKQEKLLVDASMSEIKKQIRSRSILKEEARLSSTREADKSRPRLDIRSRLVELRDKYMEFSSDTTRVASTRAMASRFSEELELLLKQMSIANYG